MPASPAPPVAPPRVLGVWQLTFLGIGAIVGSGLFVLGGQVAAQHTGPAVVLAYGLAGGAALLCALCFGALAPLAPASGSAYAYVRLAFGPRLAFAVGWTLSLIYVLSAAAVAVGWSAYAVTLLQRLGGWGWPPLWGGPGLGPGRAWANLPALAIVLGMAALGGRGALWTARLNTAIVAVKLAALGAFLLAALPRLRPELLSPLLPPAGPLPGQFGYAGLLRGTSLLFFAYNGFDAIAAASADARAPQRDVPRATVAAVVLCTLLYMAAAAALVGVVPHASLGVANPLSLALAAAGQARLLAWVEAGILVGLSSVILVNLYSAPRILCAMAQDGLLPSALQRCDAAGTPVWSQRLVTLLAAGLATALPLDVLAPRMCTGVLGVLLLVAAAATKLRWQGRLHLPWGVPVGAVLVCAVLLLGGSARALTELVLYGAVGTAAFAGGLSARRA